MNCEEKCELICGQVISNILYRWKIKDLTRNGLYKLRNITPCLIPLLLPVFSLHSAPHHHFLNKSPKKEVRKFFFCVYEIRMLTTSFANIIPLCPLIHCFFIFCCKYVTKKRFGR